MKCKKKNILLTLAALTLTAGLSVGSAMAYFTTYATAAGSAQLKLGSTVTKIDETVTEWTKHITISNTGNFDCYIRVKAFAGEVYQERLVFSDASGKWTPGADGFWYYSDILPVGSSSEELLIKIDNLEKEENFNVIVVQECTPVAYDESGSPYADWDYVASSNEDIYEGEVE